MSNFKERFFLLILTSVYENCVTKWITIHAVLLDSVDSRKNHINRKYSNCKSFFYDNIGAFWKERLHRMNRIHE